jgi:hypothetical protein
MLYPNNDYKNMVFLNCQNYGFIMTITKYSIVKP